MAMYSVRVNIDDTDLLNLIDFSEIGKGLLKLKSSKTFPEFEATNFTSIWRKLKIETYLNGCSSVGMVFLCKKFTTDHPNIRFKKNLIHYPIEGTVDDFRVNFCCIDGKINPNEIKEGEELIFIRFVTKRYHELLMDKTSDGVSSQQVNIRIYVNGKFKPYSKEQALESGIQVINSSHFDGCKFYERDYIDYMSNNFDKDGKELKTPIFEASEWIPCNL